MLLSMLFRLSILNFRRTPQGSLGSPRGALGNFGSFISEVSFGTFCLSNLELVFANLRTWKGVMSEDVQVAGIDSATSSPVGPEKTL